MYREEKKAQQEQRREGGQAMSPARRWQDVKAEAHRRHPEMASPQIRARADAELDAQSGTMAGILRDLAALDGRTPESLAVEWAAGKLVIPEGTVGDAVDDWGLFDGQADLASRVRENLRDGARRDRSCGPGAVADDSV
ncbi:hypothetical protein ACH40E_12125 [Streptomyces acidicola]|uniref:hypothetical protein n=1 Tax=Streptomyces acidicola TaxID=2596892 RepID=UPI0037908805